MDIFDMIALKNKASLGDIPNQTYITEKAKTTDVNAGLALKANQSYVDTKFGSMGSTKTFKGSCTDSELSAKTGMAVDDYWYITDLSTNKCYNGTSWVDIGNNLNIADGTVTPEKTSFFETVIGKNLYNKNLALVDKQLTTTGGVTDVAGYIVSDYCDVVEGKTIYFSQNYSGFLQARTVYRLCFYDSNNGFLSYVDNVTTVVVPANAKFMKVCVLSTYKDIFQAEYDAMTVYTEYEKSVNVIADNLSKLPETISDVETLKRKTYLYTDFSSGRYENDGTFNSSRTDHKYIKLSTENIESVEVYSNASSSCYAVLFIDNAGTVISGVSGTGSLKMYYDAIPENATYVIAQLLTSEAGSGYCTLIANMDVIVSDINKIRKISSATTDGISIVVPSKIYCVEGKILNFYYENMLSGAFAYEYEMNALPTITGSSYQPYGRVFIPTTGLPDKTVTITANKNNVSVVSGTTTLKTVPINTGNGITKNVMIIGDSKTSALRKISELLNLFESDVMDINLVGTLTGSIEDAEGTVRTVKHEGRPGWGIINYYSYSSFNVSNNAFLNPSTGYFDFAYYISNNSIVDIPDIIFIDLGANDTSVPESTLIDRYNYIINSIHSYNAGIKIVLSLQEDHALSDNNVVDVFNFCTRKVTLDNVVKKLIANFDNQEANNIYLCPQYVNVDLYNDFPTIETALSNRNTTLVTKVTDVTHLAACGYYKIADVYYYIIKYLASLT